MAGARYSFVTTNVLLEHFEAYLRPRIEFACPEATLLSVKTALETYKMTVFAKPGFGVINYYLPGYEKSYLSTYLGFLSYLVD